MSGPKIVNGITEMVDVQALSLHPDNPNRGDVAGIQESIRENGFFGFVTAQKSSGRIIAGEHRFRAAVSEGARRVPTLWLEVTDLQAKKIMLADNRFAESGVRDSDTLSRILAELTEADELPGTGYTEENLDDILAELTSAPPASAHVPEHTPRAPAPKSKRSARTLTCPHCGEEIEG